MTRSFSPKRKAAILKRFLPPHNQTVQSVSDQAGIAVSTLYNWRKAAKQEGYVMPGKKKSSDHWSGQDKLNVVVETASLTEQELSEYCRSKGLYPEQIAQWKSHFVESIEETPVSAKDKRAQQKKIRGLEKELRRKDKALAETAALLVLQKKLNTLWGDEDD